LPVRHFGNYYEELPSTVQEVADKNFKLLKSDSKHRSLRFKKVGKYWSVRAGKKYRALGIDVEKGILWFWIGSHAEYDKMVS
jgi:hypothetical protein